MNLVTFKGQADTIIVVLDEIAPFREIAQCFDNKLQEYKSFFKDANIPMKIKGRDLTEQDKQILSEILTKNDINTCIHCEEQTVNTATKNSQGINTIYSVGILRSGQEVVSVGNAIILGDVNPGAVVKADNNIIIMGNLNGRAYAGLSTSCERTFVIAYGMNPEQVGIGEYIANSPKASRKYVGFNVPEIAYVNEHRIYVDEVDFKTLQSII
ncbi:MAG: hypothetical protein BEN19_07030 [Epulopiscium sp. Nuni2H_MBin003]|nr:MAG: hypothetical protein BEN19_07030 [Epulopiscium sp. Nuni2H_MBin003]